jgi:glutathione synthase/RimK-type ligase-like ATP-grasp enzyme
LEGIERATGVDIAGMIIQYLERNAGKNLNRDLIGV